VLYLKASFNFLGLQVKDLKVKEIFVVNITNRAGCYVHSNYAGWQILGYLECPRSCTNESNPNECHWKMVPLTVEITLRVRALRMIFLDLSTGRSKGLYSQGSVKYQYENNNGVKKFIFSHQVLRNIISDVFVG